MITASDRVNDGFPGKAQTKGGKAAQNGAAIRRARMIVVCYWENSVLSTLRCKIEQETYAQRSAYREP